MLKTITAGCEVSPTLLREEKDAGHVLIGVVMVNVVSKLSSWIFWGICLSGSHFENIFRM